MRLFIAAYLMKIMSPIFLNSKIQFERRAFKARLSYAKIKAQALPFGSTCALSGAGDRSPRGKTVDNCFSRVRN